MRGGGRIATERVGELLRECLIGDTWSNGSERVAALARAADPGGLAATAEFHGVPGYARAALLASGCDGALVSALEPAYYRGVANHLRTLGDLAAVDATLRGLGIPYAVLKGPVLATQAHGRADLRAYADLDVLVPPPHFGRALEAMVALGCVPVTDAWSALRDVEAGEVGLHLPSGGALDLHWHTINSPVVRGGFAVDTCAMVSRAVTAPIGSLRIPVLDPADTMVYVAMHDVLSGSHRLLWTKDVDLLVRRNPPWEEVAVRSAAARSALVVAVAMKQASDALRTPIPVAARRTLRHLSRLPDWTTLAVLAGRVSHPEHASSHQPMVSRVVARSTRQGVFSSIRELAHRAVAARGAPALRPGEREPDADPARTRAEFSAWVDAQVASEPV